MSTKRVLVCSVAAFPALGANAALAATVKPCTTPTVAFVKNVEGMSANVILARGGEEMPLKAFLPLCKDDVLTLKTAGESVTLGIAGNPGPTRVAGPAKYTVGPAQRGEDAVSEVLKDRLLPLGERSIGQGLARSADPFGFSLLDLETQTARIKTGTRPLWVGWTGGNAPFNLTVTGPSGQTIASQPVSGSDVVLPVSDIVLGNYTISVKDANDRIRETRFDAVADVPAIVPLGVPAWMGADSSAMLSTFCVAAKDPYTWSFEAVQQIAAAPDAGLDRQSAIALISAGDPTMLCPDPNG